MQHPNYTFNVTTAPLSGSTASSKSPDNRQPQPLKLDVADVASERVADPRGPVPAQAPRGKSSPSPGRASQNSSHVSGPQPLATPQPIPVPHGSPETLGLRPRGWGARCYPATAGQGGWQGRSLRERRRAGSCCSAASLWLLDSETHVS